MSQKRAAQILDTALRLAEGSSWETLRLHQVADSLKCHLTEIQQYYRQKDDLVEAWYDRADSAMLKTSEADDFKTLDKHARLHRLIMTWLDTLAQHKKVSADMLLYKLEPGHVHLQVLGVLRISRTVQWFLEGAQSDSKHLRRISEEIGLTGIYLMTFAYWVNDRSDQQQATRDFLWRRLKKTAFCTSLADLLFTKQPSATDDSSLGPSKG